MWFPRLLLASSTRIHGLFPRSCTSLPPSFTLAAGRLASADWISLLELGFLVFLSLIVSSRSPLSVFLSSLDARAVRGNPQRFSIPASAFSRFGAD